MTLLIASALLPLLVLPGAALVWLTRRSPCRLLWGLKAAAVGGYVGLTYHLGSWYMLSTHGRYVLLGLFAVGAGYGGWRMRHQVFWTRPRGWQWAGPGLAAVLLLLSVVGLRQRSQAREIPAPPVNLTVPLRDGPVYVASGGSRSITNPHLKVDAPELQTWRGQRWGLDLVQLYPSGNRASGLYPTALARYAVFGAPVYAPCDGVVETTAGSLPDRSPPARDTARKAGNHVLLRCAPDAYVLLAHLKQGSVRVEPGDSVSPDTRLGRVGNSGNSWEPHLHISAQDTVGTSALLDADPRPITFDGRFPIRNDVVRTNGAGRR
ncbi:M23 family metallopeptidase [Salinibacter ruber]|jgi:hypothetical protein|uniref:M23ase beta-sheet core domain-containing protein n=1 Tax=Salinibacter ruber TaxID=146919 RepID=A0AAW5P8H7_9BACT|nr:M23 family metallopeptidase [Salinibacter ruber]MCS3664875.1 hypothetical protein [Salinibacter ruber]MCS3956140.1 hypothetical protein [Salinibacter ruber]MCS4055529.1 hypothetical protein [Salinibacter ruber]MCS4058596.1 hypothetical protein [Salinibacter ruber]MCS4158263.1 hypothetical protein [Salinibacter ruber]